MVCVQACGEHQEHRVHGEVHDEVCDEVCGEHQEHHCSLAAELDMVLV